MIEINAVVDQNAGQFHVSGNILPIAAKQDSGLSGGLMFNWMLQQFIIFRWNNLLIISCPIRKSFLQQNLVVNIELVWEKQT